MKPLLVFVIGMHAISCHASVSELKSFVDEAESVNLSQPVANYGFGTWDYDKFGNHRAVITVAPQAAKAKAVKVSVPWRRRDDDAGESNITLVGPDGKTIANRIATTNTRDKLELLFQPNGAGEYSIYYLVPTLNPLRNNKHFPTMSYEKYQDIADAKWKTTLTESNYPSAMLNEIQARSKYHSYYPMEVVATQSETALIADRYQQPGFALFLEDRDHPIRMQEYLPARWIENYAAHPPLPAAKQNEFYTFQIGVYALRDMEIAPKDLVWGDLEGHGDARGEILPASAIRCFNTAGVGCFGEPFSKTVNIKAGRVQPLWLGVDLPRTIKPGIYRTPVKVTDNKEGTSSICNVQFVIEPGVLEDRGDSEPHKMSRLRWLDSKIGLTDIPPAPFTPIKTQLTKRGWDNTILGRSILLDNYGMPKLLSSRIDMDQIKPTGRQLSGPILSLQSGKLLPATKSTLKLVSQTQQRVAYHSTSSHDDYTLTIDTSIEADGYMRQRLTVVAKKDITLNPSLTFAAPADTFKYLKVKKTPGGYFKACSAPIKGGLLYNIIWMGDYNIGIGFKPKNDKDEWNADNLTCKTLPNPDAWDNGGTGTYSFTIDKENKTHAAVVSAGEIKLDAGDEIRLNYALFLTPFKPLSSSHWNEFRYYHPRHCSLPMPIEETPASVRLINLHHASKLNPWINYPFLSVPALKQYVDAAHKDNKKVKLYYTVRELATRTAEIWMLRSLGDEILKPGPGYRFYRDNPQSDQTLIFTRTGGTWLSEHLVHNYVSRWHTPVAGIPGVSDASISPQGVSRWNNYYLEGQSWLIRNLGIDGVYLDGIGYDREIMRRLRKTMDSARLGSVIDYHGAPFKAFEHLPYIDSFWNGEGAKPELDEAYWLLEFSGIPFGTWGELLQPKASSQRGMVFGLTKRFGWGDSLSPKVWEWWDTFGIANCTMAGWWSREAVVTLDNPKCKATVFYKPGEKAALAIGNWDNERSQSTKLTFDWKALGLDPTEKVFYAPAITDFQVEAIFPADTAIPIPADGGMVFEIRDAKDPNIVEAFNRCK